MIFRLPDDRLWFPETAFAEPDGLLAVGGDLSIERLILAYKKGIFPWYSDDSPILWYAPHRRFVLFPRNLKVSASMQKLMRSDKFEITFDRAFPEVIRACADIRRSEQDGTWITADMQKAYINLFETGYAHSVEVWENGILAGGLYGVKIGSVFCGESMFSKVSNASKAALIWLCRNKNYSLIDCQVHTAHLESMGADFISMDDYRKYLAND
ncbi:MAG: leucyl/phenylalanyl-tRNA--protein transferase [Pedobacter sp.]